MTKRNRIDEALREELRQAGLRATPARTAVLEVLRVIGTPLTHSEVVERLDGRGWDRATVFRNLVALAEAGFVRRTDLGDHVWRFESTAGTEGVVHEHAHFLCTVCGEVECMPELELALPRGAHVPQSVRARAVEVQLRGHCDACRSGG